MITFRKISGVVFSYFRDRDLFLKKREYLSILIYFFILFLIDVSGSLNLYGQSFIRRCINMYRRIDPLSYKKKLKPFCIKYPKILNREDILKLQSIKIPNKNDIGFFNRKNTTTHQCCEKYNESEKEIIKNTCEKIRKTYENRIGKKLYYLETNKATIYRYHGHKSKHIWHVDPQNLSEIYNIIVCIKRKGNISPLQCKNKEGQVYSINFNEGDAALFNGGTTVHQVPPNNDPNSERTVLSIAFTSSIEISKNKDMSNNMCTHIESGNNVFNLFIIILSFFLINLTLTLISGINNLSYQFLLVFFIIIILLAKYIPGYFNIGLGTGRGASIYHSLILLIVFMAITLSIKGGIVFLSYFMISDLFFPRKWVEYD